MISAIRIKLGGLDLELTLNEAVALKADLDRLFGAKNLLRPPRPQRMTDFLTNYVSLVDKNAYIEVYDDGIVEQVYSDD